MSRLVYALRSVAAAALLLLPPVAAVVSCAGCPVNPAPSGADAAPPIVYDGSDVCARTCAHLVTIGCSSGDGDCVGACRGPEARRLTDFHTDCLLDAGSVEAARACKSVRCP